MDELNKKILAEKENVEIALGNIYNGIENILKQVIKEKGIEVPASSSWHKELLTISASRAIISEKLADQLYEYLTIRHLFVHAYGFMLDETHLEVLADNIPDVWSQFMEEIEMAEKYSNK